MKESRKTTLMQLQVGMPVKIIITLLVMSALMAFVYFCKIPNPNMILIAGLVFCSALFGFGGGITASVIMLGYTLFFFSTDNSFIHFNSENMQKVVVSLIGIVADMLFVCLLKKAEVQAFERAEALSDELHKENELLQQLSQTDALTGVRNRMGLRRDYDGYQGEEVIVMMLDLNNFKKINDTRGHEEGDRILKETGTLLSDIFGSERCYRYGGDEFLIILPDTTDELFNAKLNMVNQLKPAVDENLKAEFSIGYVHAFLNDSDSLRNLITQADMKMYEAKKQQKI